MLLANIRESRNWDPPKKESPHERKRNNPHILYQMANQRSFLVDLWERARPRTSALFYVYTQTYSWNTICYIQIFTVIAAKDWARKRERQTHTEKSAHTIEHVCMCIVARMTANKFYIDMYNTHSNIYDSCVYSYCMYIYTIIICTKANWTQKTRIKKERKKIIPIWTAANHNNTTTNFTLPKRHWIKSHFILLRWIGLLYLLNFQFDNSMSRMFTVASIFSLSCFLFRYSVVIVFH